MEYFEIHTLSEEQAKMSANVFTNPVHECQEGEIVHLAINLNTGRTWVKGRKGVWICLPRHRILKRKHYRKIALAARAQKRK